MKLNSILLATLLSAMPFAQAIAGGQEFCQSAAISNLEACIRRNPADLQIRKQYVLELIKVGKAKQASNEMDGLVKAGLRGANDFSLLADCCRFSGDYSKAIRYYQECLGSDATNAHASSGMALSYLLGGQPQLALKVCKQALPQASDEASRRELAKTMATIAEFEREKTIAKQITKADGISF